MIKLNDNTECCGCEACSQACPKNCIEMVPDAEGYLYPKIDEDTCINCHICENVCPYLNNTFEGNEQRKPIKAYAAYNRDSSIVKKSSSGGIFYEFAKATIERGGIVFGAVINAQHEVHHTYAETLDGVMEMLGSKYVQSHIGKAFSDVKSFLHQDKPVLFSGTPCQIAGLRQYLRKDYENLLTVDFVCHGVPSPGIWKKYIYEIASVLNKDGGTGKLKINFREKNGFSWSNYGFSVKHENGKHFETGAVNSPYMRAFITDNCLRPSCYKCEYKNNSGSDITLGDFWGIDKVVSEMYNEEGVSLLVVNTQKGRRDAYSLNIDSKEVSYQQACIYNRAINHPSPKPITRDKFFRLATNPHYSITDAVKRIAPIYNQLSPWEYLAYLPIRIKRFIYRKFKI